MKQIAVISLFSRVVYARLSSLVVDEGLGRLSHRFLVLLGHLPTFTGDLARCVAVVLGHLTQNLDEVRDFDFALLL